MTMKFPYYEARFEQRGLYPVVFSSIYRDKFSTDEWTYEYEPRKHKLILKSYRHYYRESPRHKWVTADSFGSSDRRNDTLAEMPAPPDYIADAALHAFIAKLAVD
jgi:hypothetical protein